MTYHSSLRIPFAHQNVQSRCGFHVDMNMTDDYLGDERGDLNDYAVEVTLDLTVHFPLIPLITLSFPAPPPTSSTI